MWWLFAFMGFQIALLAVAKAEAEPLAGGDYDRSQISKS